MAASNDSSGRPLRRSAGPHDCQIVISGRRWRLVYRRPSDGSEAECDCPTTPGKSIRVRPGLRRYPAGLMEALVHECLHAAGWPLSEEFVTEAAADIARVLARQGFTLRGSE